VDAARPAPRDGYRACVKMVGEAVSVTFSETLLRHASLRDGESCIEIDVGDLGL